MIRLGDTEATWRSLPPNMQTEENHAIGYAFDRQMKKLTQYLEKLLTWGDIGAADERWLGAMARSLRAIYYSDAYPEETRRNILRKTLSTYSYAGTQKAVLEMIEELTTDAEYSVWNEYGGNPYHFRILTTETITAETYEKIAIALRKAKAARSILDALDTKRIIFTGGKYHAGARSDRNRSTETGAKAKEREIEKKIAASAGARTEKTSYITPGDQLAISASDKECAAIGLSSENVENVAVPDIKDRRIIIKTAVHAGAAASGTITAWNQAERTDIASGREQVHIGTYAYSNII